MNRAQALILPAGIFFLTLILPLNAQSPYNYTFKNTSLDVVTDASSVALGESFVANPENQFAFFENPAAISFRTGMQLFYNYRSMNWMALVDKQKYFSAGGSVTTSIGNFGFAYNQFSTGSVNFYLSLLGNMITSESTNRTFMLSYSNSILKNLSAGVSAKLFNNSSSMSDVSYTLTSNNALLFDAGLLFQTRKSPTTGSINENMSVGISLQNFGTDYREESKGLFTETNYIKLPRYLRIGIGYWLSTTVGQRLQANLDFQLTGEYKRLLNPGDDEQKDVDYWGAGLEATLFKIVSLRLGGVASPENNILWDRNKFNLRYGIGLNFPLAIIGLNHPVTVKFDYAVIPVNKTTFEKSQNSLYAFSVSLVYGTPFLK